MRISKQQLQDIINEEVAHALSSSKNRRLSEALAGRTADDVLADLPAASLIKFGKAYAKLGGAVQQQLDQLLADPYNAEINPNAVEEMEYSVGRLNEEISMAIADWKEENGY